MPSVGTIRYRNGSSWIDILHPIGSFYFSTSSVSPATLFGGTWTQITGAAIRGNTSTGYTGSDTHLLTISEMPGHAHQTAVPNWLQNTATGSQVYGYISNGSYHVPDDAPWGTSIGGSTPHSIVQRSYNCYIWYRTA